MAVERRDPVPPGRYWAFIEKKNDARWSQWTAENKGKVKVVLTESQLAVDRDMPAIFVTRPDLDIIMDRVGDYVVFDVKSPVPWVGIGFPTIVTKSGDPPHASETVQAPEPGASDEMANELWAQVRNVLFLGAGVYLLGSWLSSRRR